MAWQIRELEGTFEGGRGERTAPTFSLPTHVRRHVRIREAHVALNSFDVEFLNGDHYVQDITVSFDEPVVRHDASGVTVDVSGRFGMRDGGSYDDPFKVFVRCLLLTDVEPIPG